MLCMFWGNDFDIVFQFSKKIWSRGDVKMLEEETTNWPCLSVVCCTAHIDTMMRCCGKRMLKQVFLVVRFFCVLWMMTPALYMRFHWEQLRTQLEPQHHSILERWSNTGNPGDCNERIENLCFLLSVVVDIALRERETESTKDDSSCSVSG